MNIALAGYGREGQSALRFLRRTSEYRDAKFTILDEKEVRAPRGVNTQTGASWLQNLSHFDLIVRSPGVYYHRPEFKAARKKGVQFTSPTKLFFEYATQKTKNIIGITGSKGKSTVSTLLYTILKHDGVSAHLVGNIGRPALEIIPRLKSHDWVVMELSSFQLQDLTTSPRVAVITEMFPEHQDTHATIQEYYRAKLSICRYQKPGDMVFYLAGNKKTEWIASHSPARRIAVSEKLFPLTTPETLRVAGYHQFKNVLLAARVALELGVAREKILREVQKFPGLPHRIEFVRTLGAVSFYNDSQSTNAYSVIAAAHAFPKKNVILIGGGFDKNVDYSPFARGLKKSDVRLAVLFGQNKFKIQKGYAAAGIPTKTVASLEEAVAAAYAATRDPRFAIHNSPFSLILSPGTSSFDMFKNYAERGETFKKIVLQLK